MNRSHKRHPKSHLPDPNMVSARKGKVYFELLITYLVLGVRTQFKGSIFGITKTNSSFHVGNPEGIHELLHLFSDRGTPQSVRFLNSYSGHTYKFTKQVRGLIHI